MKRILLVEPNYKNKYPPIGLMKIATYHKQLGDNVTFFKGELKDLVIRNITEKCIAKLNNIDGDINWLQYYKNISEYIKTKKSEHILPILDSELRYESLIKGCLDEHKDYYWKKIWESEPMYDRVYITTLFTFYWNITISTINFAKKLVKSDGQLKVGGIAASVLPDDIFRDTGIKPIVGLLDKPGILDKNKIVIDSLPLDYSILDEIDYQYPESNAYYGYMTRGCIRKCPFCAVPTLEPNYVDYIPMKERIDDIKAKYGDKRNLLLLDNNVLASPRFPEIIREIKEAGFYKGATFIEPNQLEIAYTNLRAGVNNAAYIRVIYSLTQKLLNKLSQEQQQEIYDLLADHCLLSIETATRDSLLAIENVLLDVYSKHFRSIPKQRYVDFNQGVDARLINEENIKLFSEIPIRPLRVAFDSMAYEKPYVNAIKLAQKFGINHLSNYILYNEKDKPVELYQRLKINVELGSELGINIYSFPMKYHPITGEYRLNREYLGTHWNRKFIRAVQAILNATKGKIGNGKSFFYKAFGEDEDYFCNRLLYMPETYILFRLFFEGNGLTELWWEDLNALSLEDMTVAKSIIEKNKFTEIHSLTNNPKIIKVLKHYTITREDILIKGSNNYELKNKS